VGPYSGPHVGRSGKEHIGFLLGKPKENYHLEDPVVDGEKWKGAHRVLLGKPEEKLSLGRPSRRWG